MSYATDVLASSPAAYWRLGESAGAVVADSSGNARNGTYVGSPTLGQSGAITGDADAAAKFDGSTQYVSVSPWTVWDGQVAFTVEAWVKLDAAAAAEKHVGGRNSQCDFRVGPSSIAFGLFTTAYAVFRVNVTVSLAAWHHVAWVYDGSFQYIYLDGALAGQTPKTGAIASGSGALSLGSSLSGGSPASALAGTLDEIAAYTTALSAATVRARYLAGAAMLTGMVSAAELEAMQDTLDASLPDTAFVLRLTRTSDGMGGAKETWSAVATVACRVSPSGTQPQERAIAERVAAAQTWTVTLPAGTEVAAADRITTSGRTFEVAGVLAVRSWEIGRRVICVEVL